ncbi:MAG: TetR/AcrR family transcriptional regulator [Nitriliruptorales bacterium]
MDGTVFNQDPRERSPLQQEHVELTRQKILDGLVRVLGRGLAGLSVPAVARESGVSVPTVYRYFKSREELLRGLAEEYEARLEAASNLPPPPPDVDRLSSYLRMLFVRYGEMEATFPAFLAAAAGGQAPSSHMLPRLRMIEDWLDTVAPGMNDEGHSRLRGLIAVLIAPDTFRAFTDYLGLSSRQVAEIVAWAIRQLVREAQNERG